MKRKFILCLLMSLCLLMFSCSPKDEPVSGVDDTTTTADTSETETVATTEEPQPENLLPSFNGIVFVSLGDSIAAHAGVKAAEGYVEILGGMMRESGEFDSVTVKNLAVGGYESGDLLRQLDDKTLEQVAEANMITISIGGNNFLHPLFSSISGLKDLSGINNALTAGAFVNQAEKGLENFKSDFPKTIEKLKQTAPDAVIFVSTIFNPCSVGDVLYDTIDGLVGEINGVIKESTEKDGYIVVDVYSAFKALDSVGLTFINFENLVLDPHPNVEGHKVIADTYYNTIFAK